MQKNSYNVINTIVGYTSKEDGTVSNQKSVSTFYTPTIISKRELIKEAANKKYVINGLRVSSKRSSRSGA